MADLRVAQHSVAVVGTPEQDGELHVSRIYADVLISNIVLVIHDESATSTMTLVDIARGARDVEGLASTMNLVSEVSHRNSTAQDSLTSTMTLAGVVVGAQDKFVSASNTLALISLGGRALPSSAINIMFLANLVGYFNYFQDRAPVGNSLGLSQSVTTLSSIEVEQDLGLVQTLSIHFPTKITITQPLGLVDNTSTPYRAFITDTLSLVSSVHIPLSTQSVTHTLNITDIVPNGIVSTEILFTHQVSFGYAQDITHDLGITQNLHLEGIWVRNATHTNILGHALTWYEDTLCGKKQYTPFQGENTITTTTIPPSNTLQDPQGDTGNFSLYRPYLGVAIEEVILRKPEMDNRDRNAYTRVSEETRGGKLIVYADPDWPKVRTLAVTVVGLTETKVDELQTFMQATVGEEIGITDWEGRLWKGFITNPNEPATQDGKAMWTISFEFQGEILDVEQPGNEDGNGMAMNMTQEVTAVIV
jgi:hypothetical protein